MKNLLDAGRHPVFVGRSQVENWVKNGGLLFFVVDGRDAAVALVQPRYNCLMVLNVHPAFRGRGVGKAVVEYLQCNWVRAIEDKVPFFEKLGYVGVSNWKQGRRYRTRIMVKQSVRRLAGRLQNLDAGRTRGRADDKTSSAVDAPLRGVKQRPKARSSREDPRARRIDQRD